MKRWGNIPQLLLFEVEDDAFKSANLLSREFHDLFGGIDSYLARTFVPQKDATKPTQVIRMESPLRHACHRFVGC
jgi:hypothetical protein